MSQSPSHRGAPFNGTYLVENVRTIAHDSSQSPSHRGAPSTRISKHPLNTRTSTCLNPLRIGARPSTHESGRFTCRRWRWFQSPSHRGAPFNGIRSMDLPRLLVKACFNPLRIGARPSTFPIFDRGCSKEIRLVSIPFASGRAFNTSVASAER